MCSTWSGNAQNDQCMKSQYRESHKRADGSFRIALAVFWCHTLIILRSSASSRTHLWWKHRKLRVFDFMQRYENRSAADLKQCMPVRIFVRLEPAPTPRHCHAWHQSAARAFREQPAQSAGADSLYFFLLCLEQHIQNNTTDNIKPGK